MFNDSLNNLIIFSCKENLSFLCGSETIYADGTFNYCTKFFTQLFTVHGFQNGHYIPLVFCLLKDKQSKTYELCFLTLVNLCKSVNLIFKPKAVIIDFEKAIHTAATNVWDNAQIVGCRFHLGQAWWRKIQELGLSAEYANKDSDTGKWLKYTFGLQYLDPCEVSECYVENLASIQPNDPRVTKYADYLIDTYLYIRRFFFSTICLGMCHILF